MFRLFLPVRPRPSGAGVSGQRMPTGCKPLLCGYAGMVFILFILMSCCSVFALDEAVDIAKISVVEGEIKELSNCPSPKRADYPDCDYTAQFVVARTIGGKTLPQNILLVMPAFRDRRTVLAEPPKIHQRYRLSVIDFEDLTLRQKSIQQADDLNLFDLSRYFLVKIEKISSGGDVQSALPEKSLSEADKTAKQAQGASDAFVSPYSALLPQTVSPVAAAAKKRFIDADLPRLDQRIAGVNSRVAAINLEFAQYWQDQRAGYNQIDGNLVWGRIDGGFFACPANQALLTDQQLSPGQLEAIKNFSEFLEKNGVQLIIQLIPDYYDVAVRVMAPKYRDTVDLAAAKICRQLLSANVEAVYTSDELVKRHGEFEFMFSYPNDHHAADGCHEIMVSLLEERLQRFGPLRPQLNPRGFSVKEISQKPWPAGAVAGDSPDIKYKVIKYKRKSLTSDPKSPVIVMGNSFIMNPGGNSYIEYFSRKFNHLPTLCGMRAAGPFSYIPQDFYRNYVKRLTDKKVVIWPVKIQHLLMYEFLDVKKMDEDNREIASRQLFVTLEVKPQADREFRNSPFYQQIQSEKSLNYPWFKIAEDNVIWYMQQKTLDCGIEIADPPPHDFIAVVRVCPADGSSLALEINGTVQNIPLNSYGISWKKLVFKLPAGTKHLAVKVKGQPGNALLIKNIDLYQ